MERKEGESVRKGCRKGGLILQQTISSFPHDQAGERGACWPDRQFE